MHVNIRLMNLLDDPVYESIWPSSCATTWTCCETDCGQTNPETTTVCQNQHCKHPKCSSCRANTITARKIASLAHVFEMLGMPTSNPPADVWVCVGVPRQHQLTDAHKGKCACGASNLIAYAPACPVCDHNRCSACHAEVSPQSFQQAIWKHRWNIF
ncbi:hypothetical protein CC80DRAFT_154288 [Byssothecium circinans]|uniref:Uncharacterized protein n=1 Tax=Byssothecium circinans TaxID=147558 RepID=A0A6A5UB30_9PLEO|nr:hypothetical protein CC80DRAFT_154288 [Byssothecium circinans]